MKKKTKQIILIIFMLIIGIFIKFVFPILFPPTIPTDNIKQLIFIGVDGMQYNHYHEMLSANRLPNFQRLISNNGWAGSGLITGHSITTTAPGNAELHTGLNETLNGISDNTCGKSIPAGKTSYERINKFNSNISLGLIYGKGTCYIPDAILTNAKPVISWWQNMTTYPQRTWVSANCADSRDVSNKALEFLNEHKNESFYITVYFGVPDCVGHTYGENSQEYNDAFLNVDDGIGILLDWINANNVNIQIILSADHGWNEGTTGHGNANLDTLTIPLITNNASLLGRIYSQGVRKQCDIAPTILDYFDIPIQTDITSNGCGSMIM